VDKAASEHNARSLFIGGHELQNMLRIWQFFRRAVRSRTAAMPAADTDADDSLLDDAPQLNATAVQPTGAKFPRAGLLPAAIGCARPLRSRRNASAAPNLLPQIESGLETRRIVAAGPHTPLRAADATEQPQREAPTALAVGGRQSPQIQPGLLLAGLNVC
jgi:hypothetical protein